MPLLEWRAAVRSLCRDRAAVACAILTLGLGIGANSAMFSVVHAVLLRPLPGFDTGRLVSVQELSERGGPGLAMPRSYREWARQARSFEGLVANQYCNVNLTGGGEPEQINALCATSNLSEVLHATPWIGRTFLMGEDTPGRGRVALLSYDFWQRRFGGRPDAVGRYIRLDTQPFEIVGVMPGDFRPFGEARDLYIPYALERNELTNVFVTGRLKPGVTIEAARAELAVIERRLAQADPNGYAGLRTAIVPLLDHQTGPRRPALLALFGAVGLVLLIACVNVANISLSRAVSRARETAIRAALGASRWQVLRPALIEAGLVSAAGAAVSVVFASGGIRLFLARMPDLPRAEEVGLDSTVFLYTGALAILAAFLSGVVPVLRPGGPRARSGPAIRNGLTVCEIALAFVLVAGTGLLLRSLGAMTSVDLGYKPDRVLALFVSFPETAGDRREAAMARLEGIRERLRQLPGVVSVATTTAFPTGGVGIAMTVEREGRNPEGDRPGEKAAQISVVSGNYFRTAGIRLAAGRAFDERDTAGSTPVAVVSESVARRYFPEGTAIGKRIQIPVWGFNLTSIGKFTLREIVGVAGTVKHASVAESDPLDIYLPEAQNAVRFTHIALRAAGDAAALSEPARKALYAEVPDLPVSRISPLARWTGTLYDGPRQAAWLLGVFAALALAMACAGVFGVVSHAMAARTREFAIRMAVGAQPSGILTLVAGHVFRLAASGILLGLALAAALNRFIAGLLFGVAPADAAAHASAALILLVLALAAAATPARRAARLAPWAALRHD